VKWIASSTADKSLLAMTKEKIEHNQQNCPSGKSLLVFGNRVKAKNQLESKIFRFFRIANRAISTPIPSRSEGRIMIVTNVGRGAVDAEAATDERG
jgi:hypothetical protein